MCQTCLQRAPFDELDDWLREVRGFWDRKLDALETEVARGIRDRRNDSKETI